MEYNNNPKIYEHGQIKRVAEATDVSVETVRKVLRNLPGVTLKTRQRVLEAAQQDKQNTNQQRADLEEMREALVDQENRTAGIVAGLALAIDQLVVLRTKELLEPLQAELAQLRARQGEWVDTKEAMRLTGIKTPETLKLVREEKGSVLVYKYEGRKVLYSRDSLVAYGEHKTRRCQRQF